MSFYLHATGTGSDGSKIRFTIRRHFVLEGDAQWVSPSILVSN